MNNSTVMRITHYENFPVASFLLPRDLQEPIRWIYAFARSADDIADEGIASAKERLASLQRYESALTKIALSQPSEDPLFIGLGKAIRDFQLPLQPFYDLISAFTQDITKTNYETYDELLNYCSRSANPIGLLMLHLFKANTDENIRYSACICSALQLINHWQDIAVDSSKGRIYLPKEDLKRFNVTEFQIANGICEKSFQQLMRFQVGRTRNLMLTGKPLGRKLQGRFGLEIRTIMAGGLMILDKIEGTHYDVFRARPKLKLINRMQIICQALIL